MQNYKKILVLNGLGIGDVIVTTPILKALRDKYPQSIITFLIRPEFEEIVKGLPFITDYVLYRKEDGIGSLLATIKKIWHYDMAICLDFKYRSAVIPFLAGIPIRAGAKYKRGLFLNHSVDYMEDENKYQTENLAGIIYRSLGLTLGNDLSNLYLPQPRLQHLKNVDKLLEGINEFITIAPYSTNPVKDWPSDRYSQLISSLSKNYKILILGSPKDTGKAAVNNAIDLTGKTSLLEMSEIIRRSRLFIGGCSGPLHIAGAVNASIVAIYSATAPTQWAPIHNTTVLYNKQECSPCINKGVDCKDYTCTLSISVEEVLNACIDRLKKPPA